MGKDGIAGEGQTDGAVGELTLPLLISSIKANFLLAVSMNI